MPLAIRLLIFGALAQLACPAFAQYARPLPLYGHEGRVNAVAFSPDGKTLASAGEDGRIRLWHAPQCTQGDTLPGQSEINSLAFSPDGTILAAGLASGRIKLVFFSPEGITYKILGSHSAPVKSVAFSPDGKYLASAGLDGAAAVWDMALLALAKGVEQGGNATGAVFSPDGKLFATSGYDGELKIWKATYTVCGATAAFRDMEEAAPCMLKADRTLNAEEGDFNCLAFSPDGKYLAAGSSYKKVYLWRVKDWRLTVIKAHSGPVNSVAFNGDSSLLASAGDDGRLRLWKMPDGDYLRSIKNYNLCALSTAFSPQAKLIAAGYTLGTVKLWRWDVEKAHLRRAAKITAGGGTELVSVPAGQSVIIDYNLEKSGKYFVCYSTGARDIEGWMPSDALVLSDMQKPVIRIYRRHTADGRLRVKGAVFDDVEIMSVRAGGADLKRSGEILPKNNFADVFPFEYEASTAAASFVKAADAAGRTTSISLNQDTPAADCAGKYVMLRAKSYLKIRAAPEPDAQVIATIAPGGEINAVGYVGGWYCMEGGGWGYPDEMEGR